MSGKIEISREALRKEFENSNSDLAWFVPGGRVEDSLPEGFEYGDFTTDMCWTCYFEARQIAAPVVERQPVVLPDPMDRSEIHPFDDQAQNEAAGWNACLDKVKELNS